MSVGPARKRQKTLDSFFPPAKAGHPAPQSSDGEVTWTHVTEAGLNISHACILEPSRCEEVFLALEREVEYLTGALATVRVFGKLHPIPRQHAAYGEAGLSYRYSGVRVPALPWTPGLAELRHLVERHSGHSYNFVLVNRYRDGNDRMGDHRDDEKELSREVPIASLSLGAERDFVFKQVAREVASVKMVLKQGMLLLMHPPTNTGWTHGLPPRKSCREPRINLTFRHILPY